MDQNFQSTFVITERDKRHPYVFKNMMGHAMSQLGLLLAKHLLEYPGAYNLAPITLVYEPWYMSEDARVKRLPDGVQYTLQQRIIFNGYATHVPPVIRSQHPSSRPTLVTPERLKALMEGRDA